MVMKMKLFKNFEIGKVFIPKIESYSQGYQKILNYVEKNCDFEVLGDEFLIKTKDYSITFFEILNDSNTNDSSQLIKIESFNKSFLFVGDISSNVELQYVEKYGIELDVDVLKVPHHGSKNGCSEKFLNVVTPKYSVICVGNNSYGHPTSEVIDKLDAVGSEVLRTDVDGNIVFVVGKNYELSPNTKNLYFTKFSLDYRVVVLIVVFPLFVNTIVLIISIFTKPKKRKKDF